MEKIDPATVNTHTLKEHCTKCSRKHRAIVSSTTDKKVISWFKGLISSDPEQYRKVMDDYDDSVAVHGQGKRGPKKRAFDLLESLGAFIVCSCLAVWHLAAVQRFNFIFACLASSPSGIRR